MHPWPAIKRFLALSDSYQPPDLLWSSDYRLSMEIASSASDHEPLRFTDSWDLGNAFSTGHTSVQEPSEAHKLSSHIESGYGSVGSLDSNLIQPMAPMQTTQLGCSATTEQLRFRSQDLNRELHISKGPSTRKAPNTETPFPFNRLPAEIRILILSQAVPQDLVIDFKPTWSQTNKPSSHRQWRHSDGTVLKQGIALDPPLNQLADTMSLLRVNREIYEEASRLLYRNNTFRFHIGYAWFPNDHRKSTINSMHHIHESALVRIRKCEIYVSQNFLRLGKAQRLQRWLWEAARTMSLKYKGSVKDLRVVIEHTDSKMFPETDSLVRRCHRPLACFVGLETFKIESPMSDIPRKRLVSFMGFPPAAASDVHRHDGLSRSDDIENDEIPAFFRTPRVLEEESDYSEGEDDYIESESHTHMGGWVSEVDCNPGYIIRAEGLQQYLEKEISWRDSRNVPRSSSPSLSETSCPDSGYDAEY